MMHFLAQDHNAIVGIRVDGPTPWFQLGTQPFVSVKIEIGRFRSFWWVQSWLHGPKKGPTNFSLLLYSGIFLISVACLLQGSPVSTVKESLAFHLLKYIPYPKASLKSKACLKKVFIHWFPQNVQFV